MLHLKNQLLQIMNKYNHNNKMKNKIQINSSNNKIKITQYNPKN